MPSSKFGYRAVRIQPPPKVCVSKHGDPGPPTFRYQQALISWFHGPRLFQQLPPIYTTFPLTQSPGVPYYFGNTTYIDGRRLECIADFSAIVPTQQLVIREQVSGTLPQAFHFELPPITSVWPYDSHLVYYIGPTPADVVTARLIIT